MGRTEQLRRRRRYRHLRRTLIALLATLALALVAGSMVVRLLQSEPALAWTARHLERRLAAELDAEVEIGRLSWRVFPPRARLEAVDLAMAPLELEIDSAEIAVDELSLLSRTLELGSVSVRGVRLKMTGLPPRRRSRGSSWLRVRARHLELKDVCIEGHDLPASIEHIELGSTDLAWAVDDRALRGFVQVGKLGLNVRGIEPVEAAVGARFAISDGLEIPFWRVAARDLALRGFGRLDRDGWWRAEGEGELGLAELDRVVRAGKVLDGRCRLRLVAGSDEPSLARAEISSPWMDVEGFELTEVEGTLSLDGSRLSGELRHSVFNGGHLRGTYSLADLGPRYRHQVHADGEDLSLALMLESLGVPAAGLAARADLTVDLGWSGKQIREGLGQGSVELQPEQGALPVEGSLKVGLRRDGLLHFDARDLAIGSSRMQWQGPLTIGSWMPAWSINAAPAVLEELIPMVNAWIGDEVIPPGIQGHGELLVGLAGQWSGLRVGVRLEASPLIYEPITLDRALVEAQVANGRLVLGPARFRLGDGTGEAEGSITWARAGPSAEATGRESGTSVRANGDRTAGASGHEAGEAGTQCAINIRGQDLPLARAAAWIGIDPDEVRGTASFTGGLRGPILAPQGSWALALQEVAALGQLLGDGHGSVEVVDGAIAVRGLSFSQGLEGQVEWYPMRDDLRLELEWPGMPIDPYGEALVRVVGPEVDLRSEISWPAGEAVQGRLVAGSDAATVRLSAGPEVIDLDAEISGAASLRAELDRGPGGAVSGRGELELEGADVLLARLLPARGVPLTGQGRVDLELDWPAGGSPHLQGSVTSLDLRLGEGPVRLLEPASFDLGSSGLVVDGLLLELMDDEVFLRWRIGPDGVLSGNTSGTLDALLLRLLVPEWEPAGQVTGVVELLGTLAEPRMEGIAEVSDLSFRLPGTRDVVSGVNGTVLLSSDEARLEGIGFRMLHGEGRCNGTIRVSDGVPELALGGAVTDLEYGLFPGLAPRLSGTWRLEGRPETLRLSGDLEVERAVLRRKDDIVAILIDWFGAEPAPATGQGIALDLHVEADRTLEARSPFFSLTGSASLDVIGTSEQPGLLGKLELHEGGDVTFQGVRYEIERGTLTFSDPVQVDPFVELQAQAWVQTYRITVRLTGTPDRLVPVLSSDPPLTEAEIISVLALGYRNEELASRGVAGMGLASTLLTRDINAELERRARQLLPVDQVRLDPFAEYSTGNPAARVTVVKQLSPSWTVIVQSNLSSNREEVVVSRWFLGPGLFLEATRDVDGSYAMDIKLRRSY